MGLAVAVGVFGLVGVHRTEGRAEAAEAVQADAVEAGLDWPAGPDAAVDLPIPPRLFVTPEAAPTTTTTLPVETTTATAPPPETTTTTTTAPPPPLPPTTAPKAAPRPAATGPEARAQVEAIADSSGWNWRAAGVRFNLQFHPTGRNWGVYEAATSIIWIGPTAFGDPNRLRYVVLHELAHAWQYRQNRFAQFIDDYATWGFKTIGPALEAGADCVARLWGAGRGHYWNCPADAQALATRRLRGDWR
ncbi:MAG: hypothetical protein ACRDYF_13495 [Acidimicrobiia bacterium]